MVEGLRGRRERIDRLLRAGIEVRTPDARQAEKGGFEGLSFCFTGAVQRENETTGKPYTRKQLQAIVKELGGNAASGVSAGLSYLVMADPSSKSSKAQKARKLGTEILAEEAFFDLVENVKSQRPNAKSP